MMNSEISDLEFEISGSSPMDPSQPPQATKSPVRRLTLLAVVLAAALVLVYFTPVKQWVQDVERIRAALAAMGIWAYPVSVLVVALLVGCGLPRLIFCFIGGALLGLWWGLLVTQLGTLLGHYSLFLFVRWAGRDWVLRRWPKLQTTAGVIAAQGTGGVMLARQVPLPGVLINLCLGLSHVTHVQFLGGTLLGLLPEGVPATLIGAGLLEESFKSSLMYIAIAAVAFAVLWVLAVRALRRARGKIVAAEVKPTP